MTNSLHQLVQEFLDAVSQGELPTSLVTDNMAVWTLTSGDSDKASFAKGIKFLSSIFGGTLTYHIDSIAAEEDRVIAEVHSTGVLINGQDFYNVHVFALKVEDGKVSSMREYMNPIVVGEQIVPLMQEMMKKADQ